MQICNQITEYLSEGPMSSYSDFMDSRPMEEGQNPGCIVRMVRCIKEQIVG